ncbi:MAG: hypothetical protein KatS3mg027_0008 [Bacteroidia bacterium]|nr:MAG: hypothetical protein KatS3mg027_0008 [Bacteroidia bacterium]
MSFETNQATSRGIGFVITAAAGFVLGLLVYSVLGHLAEKALDEATAREREARVARSRRSTPPKPQRSASKEEMERVNEHLEKVARAFGATETTEGGGAAIAEALYRRLPEPSFLLSLRPSLLATTPEVGGLLRHGQLDTLVKASAALAGVPDTEIEEILLFSRGPFGPGPSGYETLLQVAGGEADLEELRRQIDEALAKLPPALQEGLSGAAGVPGLPARPGGSGLSGLPGLSGSFPLPPVPPSRSVEGRAKSVLDLARKHKEMAPSEETAGAPLSDVDVISSVLDLLSPRIGLTLVVKARSLDTETVRENLQRYGLFLEETPANSRFAPSAARPMHLTCFRVRYEQRGGSSPLDGPSTTAGLGFLDLCVDREAGILGVCAATQNAANILFPFYAKDETKHRTLLQCWNDRWADNPLYEDDYAVVLELQVPEALSQDRWPEGTVLGVGVKANSPPELTVEVRGPAVTNSLLQGLEAAAIQPGPLDDALPTSFLRELGTCKVETAPGRPLVLLHCLPHRSTPDLSAQAWRRLVGWLAEQDATILQQRQRLKERLEEISRFQDTEREGLPLWTLSVDRMSIPDRPPYGLLAGNAVEFNTFRLGLRGQLVLASVQQGRTVAEMELWFPTVAPLKETTITVLPGDRSGRVIYRILDPTTRSSAEHVFTNLRLTEESAFAMRIEIENPRRDEVRCGVYVCLLDNAKSVVAGRFRLDLRRRP